MSVNDLIAGIKDSLDEYREDGLAWDEDDLRSVLDNLVIDFDELHRYLG